MLLSLLLHAWWTSTEPYNEGAVFRSRLVVVRHSSIAAAGSDQPLAYHSLIRGRIDFGRNYLPPAPASFRRLASTYHHPHGPVGRVMDKFNWFHDKPGAFHSDARLPAALVGAFAASPLTAAVSAWSEPPVAVIGLHAGELAAYARPLQQMHN